MSENDSKRDSGRKFPKTGAIENGAAVAGLTIGLLAITNIDKSGKLRHQVGFLGIPLVAASALITQTAFYGATIPKYVDQFCHPSTCL